MSEYEKYQELKNYAKKKYLTSYFKHANLMGIMYEFTEMDIKICDICDSNENPVLNPFTGEHLKDLVVDKAKISLDVRIKSKYEGIVVFNYTPNPKYTIDNDEEVIEVSKIKKLDNDNGNSNSKYEDEFAVNTINDITKEFEVKYKKQNLILVQLDDEIQFKRKKLEKIIGEINISNKKKNDSEDLSNELSTLINKLSNDSALLNKKIEKQALKYEAKTVVHNVLLSKIMDAEQIETKYIEMGLIERDIPSVNEIDENYKSKYNTISEKAIAIQAYLDKHGYPYDSLVLEKFYVGLMTGSLTILSGPPGSGKTSLVEMFSEATSCSMELVSVQANWLDNQDVLGFYNPIDGEYYSTSFLEALIDAKKNSNKLCIICLDEMNIANVEYYFSEFLSKMQTKEPTIELYSREVEHRYSIKQKKLEQAEKEDKFTNNDKEELAKILRFRRKFPREFKVPTNVRFVATINRDATTKDLSPKVIDRSFIIELKNEKRIRVDNSITTEIDKRDIAIQYKNVITTHNDSLIHDATIEEIKEIFKGTCTDLSYRFDNLSNSILSSISPIERAIDVVISTLVLPKIRIEVDKDDSKVRYILGKLSEKKCDSSSVIFEDMVEYLTKSKTKKGMLSYWR